MVKTWKRYWLGAYYGLGEAIGKTYRFHTALMSLKYNQQAVRSLAGILPYTIHHLHNNKESDLILLNRDYKPLGILPYDLWVEYEPMKHLHLTHIEANILYETINIPDIRTDNYYYFYNDLTAPWVSKANALFYYNKILLPVAKEIIKEIDKREDDFLDSLEVSTIKEVD